MPKPSGILETPVEEVTEPLTDDQKKEIEEYKESMDWSGNADLDKVKGDEKEKIEEPAGEEKPEAERIAEEEKQADDERVSKLAEEQGKTVEEIRQAETEEKAAEEAKGEEQKELERVETIAKEEGLTVEEVKEAEAKDLKVVENYGNDPKKIAKALRKENSAYGKLKAEHDKLSGWKKEYDAQRLKYNEERVNTELEAQRDKIVEEYIKFNPNESNEDEAVLFERAKVKVKKALEDKEDKQREEVRERADEARGTIISSIPEEYKEYTPDIKEVLNQEDNDVVLSEDFDIQNICYWARGKKMTPEYVDSLVKAAEKRGMEQPEILEKKSGSVSTGSRTPKPEGKNAIVGTATVADKERASEMFGNKEGWSEDKKLEEYMTNYKNSDTW